MEENELVGELLQRLTNEFYNGNFTKCFGDLENYARFHEQLTSKLEPQQKGRRYAVGRNVRIGKKWVWCGVTPGEFNKVFPDIFTLLSDFYAYKKVDVKIPYVRYPVVPIQCSRVFNGIITRETRKEEPLEVKLERYSKTEGLSMTKRVAYNYLFRKTFRKLALEYLINFQEDKVKELMEKYHLNQKTPKGEE